MTVNPHYFQAFSVNRRVAAAGVREKGNLAANRQLKSCENHKKADVMDGKKTPIIGFRLDATSQQRLEGIGRDSGVSVHEVARSLVLEGLSETRQQEGIHERIAEVNANIDHLRKGLAYGIQALLMSTGKVEDEEAKSWVDRNIRK